MPDTRHRKPHRRTWTRWRRLSQAVWLTVFFLLFIQTDYHGSDTIPYAVNILFRIDPLIGTAAMAATRILIPLVLPGLFFLLSALILGRWFCGWMCPMGTLLDATRPLKKAQSSPSGNRFRTLRFALLLTILAAAVSGLPLVGWFDPFAILVRGLSVSIYPAVHSAIVSLFTFTYRHAPESLNNLSEPIYNTLKNTILPFRESTYKWSLAAGIPLIAVFVLECLQRRNFCRNICPLGALYGLAGHIGLLKAHGGNSDCGSCRICRNICRTGAIDEQRRIALSDCVLCMDCVDSCPRAIISFNWKTPAAATPAPGIGISRRTFIGAVATGLALPPLVKVHPAIPADLKLIRPPGAAGEHEFLSRCVRCGECMKVCIGNALHPLMLEAGIDGVFSPVVLPRVGYCEYNCTLCGQVCPTGAISRLPIEDKRQWVIGTAAFDTQRCLPYRGVNCMVCEEHCPVQTKAIRFREQAVANPAGTLSRVKVPYVVPENCIGCGICENKCPLPGEAAIRVTAVGETRNPMNADPALGAITSYPY